MKNEVWCVFQDNVARKLDLQRGTISFQFTNHAFTVCRAESAYEHMRALQVGRNINSVNADECAFEV